MIRDDAIGQGEREEGVRGGVVEEQKDRPEASIEATECVAKLLPSNALFPPSPHPTPSLMCVRHMLMHNSLCLGKETEPLHPFSTKVMHRDWNVDATKKSSSNA